MELASLDYHYLVPEWQRLVGARIQKIYIKGNLLSLHIYAGTLVKWLFTDGISWTTTADIMYPQNPPGFCMFLRKRLIGSKIRSIKQQGFDRIIRISIDTREGPAELIVELFGECNAMFVVDNKIISAWHSKEYADRTIKRNGQYEPPPGKPAPWDADLNALIGKEAAKTFATELGLGGRYAEELCSRAGIDNKSIIQSDNIIAIQNTIIALRDEIIDAKHNTKEALPFAFNTKTGEWSASANYNDAIDKVSREQVEETELRTTQKELKQKISKQERIREAQSEKIAEFEAAANKNQELGEAIYLHYATLKPLLETLKNEWKNHTLKELQEKYKDHPLIKAVRKDGSVEIEL